MVKVTIGTSNEGIDAQRLCFGALVRRSKISRVLSVKGVLMLQLEAGAPATPIFAHYTAVVGLNRNWTHLGHWFEPTDDARLLDGVRALLQNLRNLGRFRLFILAKELGFNLLPELL